MKNEPDLERAPYEAGMSKVDMTVVVKGIGMLGYGIVGNTVEGIGTPIFARAFSIKDRKSNSKFVLVNAEICFITPSLKRGVVEDLERDYPDLGYHDENIMLTAQHTHSAPGGYSHFGLYNITTPGYVPRVYQAYKEKLVQAIVEADRELSPARLSVASGSFEPDVEVAFNRSLPAFNANPDTPDFRKDQTHLAVDRQMTILRIEDEAGTLKGAISWFGVHTTSLSNDNHYINSDNKGYAATYLEEWGKSHHEDFIAAFAQAPAGDITPNFVYDKKKGWTRGKYPDDVRSAEFNGNLQFLKAKEILEKADAAIPLEGGLDFAHSYYDFTSVEVPADLAGGKKGNRTARPALGVAFFRGTKEGPGMPAFVKFLSEILAYIVQCYELSILCWFSSKEKARAIRHKYAAHGTKYILMEPGDQKILGTRNLKQLIVPAFVDKAIHYLKAFHKKGALSGHHWAPHVLPLQLLRLGNFLIAAVPMEPTITSGKRLRETLEASFKDTGVEQVIIAPYANAYGGYVTTPEEYRLQLYEGGHTLYGKWTLPALRACFRDLADRLNQAGKRDLKAPGPVPAVFSDEELALWTKPEFGPAIPE